MNIIINRKGFLKDDGEQIEGLELGGTNVAEWSRWGRVGKSMFEFLD
jgi:hypothetical protein